jgi:AraC-like DNA-binding protein
MNAFWNYRPYNGATSIEIGRLETTCPISLCAHLNSKVQVGAVAQGWCAYSTPLGDFCASPGDIIIIPACLPHASYGSAAAVVTHLYVPNDHPSAHGIVVPQIIQCVRARSPSDVLDAVGSICKDRRDNQSASRRALLAQVLDRELDISSIAAQLGYSTDGFIRAFRRQFGMTPAAYRLAHRLMKARSQLKKGRAIADVANATGFADQSHFGRLFRRTYAITPGAYRSAFTTA